MPKLPRTNQIIKTLTRKGFVSVSQKGSHQKFKKKDDKETKIVIVPAHNKEIPVGTFKSILRQSGLSAEDFSHK